MSIVVKETPLKLKQIETEYFNPWEKRLKAAEADLVKRERELHEQCVRDVDTLKVYKAKLRKFNYQNAICEVIGLDRIDRLARHLQRKIIQYNEYCKVQELICESDKLSLVYLIKERKLLHKERSEFYKEKQLFIKSKYGKI
jgi:hypothetical protein